VDRRHAAEILQRLHRAQGSFYAGRGEGELRRLLSDRIRWHVPGRSAIAGHYTGIDQVMDYFARRRDLAGGSLRLHPGELMVGEGQMVTSLTEGTAVFDGRAHRWSTVGLYRLARGQIETCWLLPLEPEAFDRIWAPADAGGERRRRDDA
jgi:SnoaL-like domain